MYIENERKFVPNAHEKSIFHLYEDLGIGVSASDGKWLCKRELCNECRRCDKELSMPSSIWQVGDYYFESKYKLLLVGKVARGNPGSAYSLTDGSSIIDTTGKSVEDNDFHGFEGLKNWNKSFWVYSRELVQQLYGENGWEYIAFTNMVKCNSSYGKDTTPRARKNNCAEIIKREIALLEPKNIVFYTNKNYDEQIGALFEDILNLQDTNVNVGKRDMPLRHFTAELNGKTINCIRVAHPQGKDKEKFINAITERLIF